MWNPLKFWHNWFHRVEPAPALPETELPVPPLRRHPSHIAVRALMRQRQRQARAGS